MAGSGTAHLGPPAEALLRVERLRVEYPVDRGRQRVHAVSDVSLEIRRGETLGLVGESGCGKSSLARAVMQIPPPSDGTVTLDGVDVTRLRGRHLKDLRPKMQMIFQDPISSLNPRRRVDDIVAEPLRIWSRGTRDHRREAVRTILEEVGLNPDDAAARKPLSFSGGQCQRISIARALVLQPEVLICDEPVSALDVSVQAQILNLLEDMKASHALTMLFIAHDLAVVKHVSDRVAVMYLGKLCEIADPETLYRRPAHPYTAALLDAIPEPDPTAVSRVSIRVPGEPPSPLAPPSGCRFRTRCPRAQAVCVDQEPAIREIAPGQFAACHFPLVASAPSGSSALTSAAPPAAGG